MFTSEVMCGLGISIPGTAMMKVPLMRLYLFEWLGKRQLLGGLKSQHNWVSKLFFTTCCHVTGLFQKSSTHFEGSKAFVDHDEFIIAEKEELDKWLFYFLFLCFGGRNTGNIWARYQGSMHKNSKSTQKCWCWNSLNFIPSHA